MARDITKLTGGFKRFQETYIHSGSELFEKLKRGQRPNVMVVGCSDSRVAPALLFDTDPGDIFVVRNIANLIPPYEPDERRHGVSAALEYGVRELGVEHLIVLGHSQCGGICALMKCAAGEAAPTEFVDKWVDIARPAYAEVMSRLKSESADERLRAAEQAAILVSIDNLHTFPWIEKKVAAGELAIHGWYFDLQTGELLTHEPDGKEFVPLVTADGE